MADEQSGLYISIGGLWVPVAAYLPSGVSTGAGVTTSVQYNNAGITAGDSRFTYNNSTNTVSIGNVVASGNVIANGNYYNLGNVGGTTGYGLRSNSGTVEFKNSGGAWAGIGTGTGSGSSTPSGVTTTIQYNNAGVFAGDSRLTYTNTTNTVSMGNVIASGTLGVSGVVTLAIPLGVTSGGTNLSTIAAGSILGANTLNTITAVNSTTGTNILTNIDGTVAWTLASSVEPPIVALASGGTSKALTASNGGIVYTDTDSMEILAGTATAQKILMSQSSSAPIWSTPTYPNAATPSGSMMRADGTNWQVSNITIPNTITGNQLLYAGDTNAVSGLPTGNSSVLVTSAGGVPSLSTTLPTGLTVPGYQVAHSSGNLTEATSSVLTVTGGTSAVLGAGTSIQVKQATTGQAGYLSSADWNTFSGKQAALSSGNLTAGSSKVSIGGTPTGALIGAGATVDVTEANLTHNNIGGLTVGNPHTQYVTSVSDTGSIDLTVGAQSISGVVIPGGVDHNALLNTHNLTTSIDHNTLTNYSANRHIDHTGVSIIAGVGISGGGDLSSNRTITNIDTGSVAVSGHISAYDHTQLHVPITVGDSTSIDLTLVGQLVSGVVLPGGVNHNSLLNTHNLTTSIDHNTITNNHNLTTSIDHGSISGLTDNDHIMYVSGVVGAPLTLSSQKITFNYDTNDFSNVSGNLTIINSGIDHDATTNFVANEHIDHTTVSLINGNGISCSGNLASNRTIALTTLTSDWDIGASRSIQVEKIIARSNAGLSLYEDGGTGIFVKDGGNVGIGTVNPTYKLVVYGTTGDILNLTENTATGGSAQLKAQSNVAAYFSGALGSTFGLTLFGGVTGSNQTLIEAQSASSFYIGTLPATPIIFAQNRVEKIRIDTAGNVGIGTTAPSAKLAINGGVHVGGDSDPGDNNLLVDGTFKVVGNSGFYNTAPVAQPTGIAAQKINYAAGDLDTEAEIITALNTTNTAINALRTALNALGLTTTV